MPGQEGLSPVEKLNATHDVDSFECGKEPLDRFLKRFALANLCANFPRNFFCDLRARRIAWLQPLSGSVTTR